MLRLEGVHVVCRARNKQFISTGDFIGRVAEAYTRPTLPELGDDDAMRREDAAAADQAMSRLIGLGVGGTPEGDDYLVGYFCGVMGLV